MKNKVIDKLVRGFKNIQQDGISTQPFSLEMRTKNCITLCGVSKVSKSDDGNVVCLLSDGEKICVEGVSLNCVSYGNGSLEIIGNICRFEMER